MKKKLFIIAGALVVIGAGRSERAVLRLPGPDGHICGSNTQLFYFVGRPCRHSNYGIECGLQRHRAAAPSPPAETASAGANADRSLRFEKRRRVIRLAVHLLIDGVTDNVEVLLCAPYHAAPRNPQRR
jgi:hypothetical protein